MLETKETYQEKPVLAFYGNNAGLPIMKYGGASLASSDDIRILTEVVEREDVQILVVSAMSGITSKLETIATTYVHGSLQAAWQMLETDFCEFHKNVCLGLQIDPLTIKAFDSIRTFIEKKVSGGNPLQISETEFVNGLIAYGEIISCEIIQTYLNSQSTFSSSKFFHIDAQTCIFMDDFGDLKYEMTTERLVNKLHVNRGRRMIMAGFIGAEYKNLQRNGSDMTAALVAGALVDVGLYPAFTLFKENAFRSKSALENNCFSYDDFLASFEETQQDYVDKQSVEFLKRKKIVARIICKNDPNFEIFISHKSRKIAKPESVLKHDYVSI